jgi:hypothetical protein
MFFRRWEEGLCVMLFGWNVCRCDEFPDETKFFQTTQNPPSRIKLIFMQSQLRAFREGMMIIVPTFPESDEAK